MVEINKKANSFRSDLLIFFCLLIFVSLCLSPFIPIKEGFYLRLEDLILPFVAFLLIPEIRLLKFWYFLIIVAWAAYGVLTMAINGRLGVINDYFELYKLLKYVVFVMLFYTVFKLEINFHLPVVLVFLALLVVNCFHFYNFLGFNEIVMPKFATNPLQLNTFGLDSLGRPTTKRIIGTMGNPNINGILFSFFALYFMRFLGHAKMHWGKIFFFLAIAMMLLTQARTSMLAMGIALLVYVLMAKLSWQTILKIFSGIALSIIVVRLMDEFSLGYVTNAKLNLAENTSLRGRFEVWAELWSMIKEKPLFGYGINKNYFYAHHLYSENEFVLIVWRYGIIGLLFYLAMVFSPLVYRKNTQKRNSEKSMFFSTMLIVYSVNALTNNPLSDPVLQVLFAIGVAYYLSQFDLNEKKIEQA